MKQAKIMIGRCNDKRPFAIRVEYKNNDWVRTWAFALSERMLKNERYGEEKITGSFYLKSSMTALTQEQSQSSTISRRRRNSSSQTTSRRWTATM